MFSNIDLFIKNIDLFGSSRAQIGQYWHQNITQVSNRIRSLMMNYGDYVLYTELYGLITEAFECLIAKLETLKFNHFTKPSYLTLGSTDHGLQTNTDQPDSVTNLLLVVPNRSIS